MIMDSNCSLGYAFELMGLVEPLLPSTVPRDDLIECITLETTEIDVPAINTTLLPKHSSISCTK